METSPRRSEGDLPPREALEATLQKIDRLDPEIGAFVEVLAERATTEAVSLRNGRRGILHGMPVAIKELFDVRSGQSSYGSLVRTGRRANADATIVQRLNAAGAVIVGLTRAHEFGWGITTQHEQRGSTRNPLDLSRVPGGSSGGSAAAVAAGMVPLAIGTDTGGSIRIPAAFCGVLGLKTTTGQLPRHGSVPLAPSFDTVGLLARSIDVLRRGLQVTAESGFDRLAPSGPGGDLRCAHREEKFSFAAPSELQPRPLVAARGQALDMAAVALAEIGGRQVDVAAPSAQSAGEIFVPQIMAEAHYVHTHLLGTWPREAASYGKDVAARLRASESVTLTDYLVARAETDALRAAFRRIFETTDVLVNVVGASGPSTINDPDHVTIGNRRMSLLDAMMPSTLMQNLAGLPSLTVPIGVDEDGLPIGVQLCGPPNSEPLLLRLGRRLEMSGAFVVSTCGLPTEHRNSPGRAPALSRRRRGDASLRHEHPS